MRLTCFILATVGIDDVCQRGIRDGVAAGNGRQRKSRVAFAAAIRPRPKPHPKVRPSAPDPALAGFGDRVPLSFAVRQIVPARFQVAFGEAVDRDAPVDWKGGKPWRPTLSEALRPLGLAVSVVGPTVTIERAASPR